MSHGLEAKANPASLEFVDCDSGFLAGELGLVFCDLGGESSSFSSSVRFRFLSDSPPSVGVWDFAFCSHICSRQCIKHNQCLSMKYRWTIVGGSCHKYGGRERGGEREREKGGRERERERKVMLIYNLSKIYRLKLKIGELSQRTHRLINS